MSENEYNKNREPYEKISKGRLRAIEILLGDYKGKTILDIGCGSGELGRLLKEKNTCTVYGIDISKDAVEKAQAHIDGAWVADISEGVFPEELGLDSVDVVVISEVLEHLFDPRVLLSELHKKTDAPVVITVPNILFWKNRFRILFGHFEYTESGIMDYGHIRFFSWKSFQELFETMGYKIESSSHVVPTRGTKWIGQKFPNLLARQFAVLLR